MLKNQTLCNYCESIAKYKLQNIDHVYKIDKDGNYKDIDEFLDTNPRFYCESHFNKYILNN